jgi:anthranilate synthase component II
LIIVIDNYDSFTSNLVQYLGELGRTYPVANDLRVYRNDQISLDEIRALAPAAIVISPGPGRPEDAGISLDIIRELGPTLPILGVCLGHQSIGQVYGGDIVSAPALMHGKTSPIFHLGVGVFEQLNDPFTATRYHSLIIERSTCPAVLEITAWTEDGIIMGVRHREYPHLQGVQFHPESILTESGKQLLQNFLTQLPAPVAA